MEGQESWAGTGKRSHGRPTGGDTGNDGITALMAAKCLGTDKYHHLAVMSSNDSFSIFQKLFCVQVRKMFNRVLPFPLTAWSTSMLAAVIN